VLFHPVPRLVSGEAPVGVHSVTWDGLDQSGLNVSSGVYLYLLTTDTGLRDVRKMLLVR
jgi:flagellar hook assembly protein FlgD